MAQHLSHLSLELFPLVISSIVLAYAQPTDREKIVAWIRQLPNATFTVPDRGTQIQVRLSRDENMTYLTAASWSYTLHAHVTSLVDAARHSGHIERFRDCECTRDACWTGRMSNNCYLNQWFVNAPADSHHLSLALAHELDQW